MKLFDVYPLFDVTPVRARDVYVFDDQDTQYLDLYGGHAVISIGHAHPKYVESITQQLNQIGFYSNAVKNPLQIELAKELAIDSGCQNYELFLCSSGAEANENALKLASFHTNKASIIAFENSFHGRTSAAVASTDNTNIIAPLNAQQKVDFHPLGDLEAVENTLKKGETCAVIIECIQGVGGLDQSTTAFCQGLEILCKTYGAVLIADEVQSGFGRSGDFFAFQKHGITPHIISIAKFSITISINFIFSFIFLILIFLSEYFTFKFSIFILNIIAPLPIIFVPINFEIYLKISYIFSSLNLSFKFLPKVIISFLLILF